MAVLETTVKRYRGLSTDARPGLAPDAAGEVLQKPPQGSTFTALDTGQRWIFYGSEWVVQRQTLDTLLVEIIDRLASIEAVLRATHAGNEAHVWGESVTIEL